MRSASRTLTAAALLALPAALAAQAAATPPAMHGQRYAMGTLFDIVVYHAPREAAAEAIERALAEIARLDGVLSHYRPDSDLSRLVREGRTGFVAVEPSLYEVIEASLHYSRVSRGRFDVTIGPLLRVWQEARERGTRPGAAALDRARRCVGHGRIELRPPHAIRLHSECLELDLGAIGKGYAVDRAVAILRAAGVRSATVNAGSSTIAAIGAPPGRRGWPVQLRAPIDGRRTLLLKDATISTAQQNGDIVDPRTGEPAASPSFVSVVAPTATASDALDTTLVLLPRDEGVQLLASIPGAAALWASAAGDLQSSHGFSGLQLARAR